MKKTTGANETYEGTTSKEHEEEREEEEEDRETEDE